jgi:hypothetical protein
MPCLFVAPGIHLTILLHVSHLICPYNLHWDLQVGLPPQVLGCCCSCTHDGAVPGVEHQLLCLTQASMMWILIFCAPIDLSLIVNYLAPTDQSGISLRPNADYVWGAQLSKAGRAGHQNPSYVVMTGDQC